jgi:hypothetical protein
MTYRTAVAEQKMIVFDQCKLIEDLINGLRSMPPDFVERFRRGDFRRMALNLFELADEMESERDQLRPYADGQRARLRAQAR